MEIKIILNKNIKKINIIKKYVAQQVSKRQIAGILVKSVILGTK
ncbi:hypothetical protein JM83_1901 [Gillisia sp. Hel_I_86]|nr:hypothetical protein JM83_1901 [Gillisia sp. Hel_I_86]